MNPSQESGEIMLEKIAVAFGWLAGWVFGGIHLLTHKWFDKHVRFSLWLMICTVVAAIVHLLAAQAGAGKTEQLHDWLKMSANVHWFRAVCDHALWPALAALCVMCWRFLIVACACFLGLGVLAAIDGSATMWLWWAIALPLFLLGFKAAESSNPLDLVLPYSEWRAARAQRAPSAAWVRSENSAPVAQPQEMERQESPVAPPQAANAVDRAVHESFPAMPARKNFSHVSGMAELKGQLTEAATAIMEKNDLNGILLWGEPGNGKTLFAEALAGQKGLPWVSISISNIVSKWIGQGPETLRAVFASARAQAPCVLFIDEADSIFSVRDAMGSTQDQANLTNVFLTEAVALRGSGVVLIAATNSLERTDPAAIREGRFDFKIEVPPPDYRARLALLTDGMQRHAPGVRMRQSLLKSLARRWGGFSVARLVAVTKQIRAVLDAQGRHGQQELSYADVLACLRKVQGRANMVPENAKSLSELVLRAEQRTLLMSLAHRMQSVFETEQLGGNLPNGVLLWGPPGTGKTEAARALAKDTGWAFLTVAGNDLVSDPSALDKLWRQAKDARPAIVFIDEADDVLADREFSPARSVTAKLLTIMDGVSGSVPDLLFLAATNYPGSMDTAAMRGGRFSEKIEFANPEPEGVEQFVQGWLQRKGWTMDPKCDPTMLFGQSIANVSSILQAALNLSIAQAREQGQPVSKKITSWALRTAMTATRSDFG
jgi:transitional endoplasmic reticulum ATPase